MEACSKCHALVRYDDGSKSVLYYSAEIWRILTLRNFHFLKSPDTIPEPEQLVITTDDAAHKGGSRDDVQHIVNAKPRPLNLEKHPAKVDTERTTKRQTRGRKVNYKQLNNPWLDDKTMNAEELTNLLEGDDDQPTFN